METATPQKSRMVKSDWHRTWQTKHHTGVACNIGDNTKRLPQLPY